MIEEAIARLRTHRNNIHRYRRLLKTELTELERQYLEKRLSEELFAMKIQSDLLRSSRQTETGSNGLICLTPDEVA